MIREIFFGLTTQDFGNALLNDIGYTATILTAFATAAVTSRIVHAALKSYVSPDSRYYWGFWLSTGAGIAATFLVANRVPFVTLQDRTAFRFLVTIFGGMYVVPIALAVLFKLINSFKTNPLTQGDLVLVSVVILLLPLGGAFAHIGRGQLYGIGSAVACISSENINYLLFKTK